MTHADIQLPLPARAESPLRSGNADCAVYSNNTTASLGWATALEFDPDNDRMDISFSWIEPAWVENPYTYCSVTSEHWTSTNGIMWSGYPDESDPALAVDAPEWINPPSTYISVPLHDMLRWSIFGTDLIVQFVAFLPGQMVWSADAGTDATMLILPEPPSSAASEDFFSTTGLYGLLRVGVLDEARERVLRSVDAPSITLAL
jgi:hypothetical protein